MMPPLVAILLFGFIGACVLFVLFVQLWILFGWLFHRSMRRREGTRYTLQSDDDRWWVISDDGAADEYPTKEQALLHLGRSIREDDR
jgi:hypothetical protein